MHGVLRLPDVRVAQATSAEAMKAAARALTQRLQGWFRGSRPAQALAAGPDDELWSLRCAEGEARAAFDEAMETWACRGERA